MASSTRLLFVNLPVRDLKKSMEFFAKLGFDFNPKFTDDNAACMIISDKAFAMLLVEPFFKTFIKKEMGDAGKTTEALFALSCDSREEVESLYDKAVAGGATQAKDAQDHGFMYSRSFYDLDGHHWEVLWMDPAVAGA